MGNTSNLSKRTCEVVRCAIEPLASRLLLSADLKGATLRIEGTPGDDSIVVSLHQRYINLMVANVNGAQRYFALGDVGHVAVLAGAGNDNVVIDAALDPLQINSWIEGQDGNDTITGNGWADTLRGGAGDDSLIGGAGNDRIDGGDGSDRLIGERGNDTLSGENGEDNIRGGGGRDSISGGDQADIINGDAGSDSIDAGGGADVIRGGNDPDSILAGTGNDLIKEAGPNDTVNGGDGNDQLFGAEGVPYHNRGPYLFGDAGDDLLIAGNLRSNLFGGEGDDTVRGGDEADHIEGGTGDDLLEGGAGSDNLYGNDGDDALYGGADSDTLYGGNGNDNLYGTSPNRRGRSEEGNDVGYGSEGTDWFQPDHQWANTDVTAEEMTLTQNVIANDPNYSSGYYSGASFSLLAANFNVSGYYGGNNYYGGSLTVSTSDGSDYPYVVGAPEGAYQLRQLSGAAWLYGGTPVGADDEPIAQSSPNWRRGLQTVTGFLQGELSASQRSAVKQSIIALPQGWRIGGMTTARDGIVWYRLSYRSGSTIEDSVRDAGTWRFLAVKSGTVIVTATGAPTKSVRTWSLSTSLLPLPSRGTVSLAGQSQTYSLAKPPVELPVTSAVRAILVSGGAIALGDGGTEFISGS